MSESFFFACIPRYLRVEHSFAKGIKPNTKYRMVVFKGIQKGDEMKQAIKSKIVGGKIDLESPQLFFNIPFYNSTKNIHFNLKLYEQKPNQDETEIGSYTIMSSDYIKSYKTDNKVWHQVEGMLKDDLFCVFDLIVEKSKFSLTDAVKKYNIPVSKASKQIIEDNNSQSSRSRQAVREGQGFLSPRKRLQRKNVRSGKLRSRNSSRSDGEQSQEGSVTNSRGKFRKSPPSGRQERFLQSPKRLSPSKNSQRPKSIPKSDYSQSKIETQSQAPVGQKPYRYQLGSNLKSNEVKQSVEVKIERKPQKQNIVQKPQIAKSNIVSASSPREIKPSVSQSSIRQPVSQLNDTQPLSPRSPAKTSAVNNSVLPTSPKSVTQSVSRPPRQQITPSVANPKINRADFEIKHTQKVFEIVQKKEESIIQISPQFQKVTQTKTQSLDSSKVKGKTQNVEQQQNEKTTQSNNNEILREDKSQKTGKSIQTKEKQVKRENKSIVKSERMQVSVRMTQNKSTINAQAVQAEKLAVERKNKIIYAIFLVVSAFLIYNAMMPTRRA